MNYYEMKNGLVVMQAEDGEFKFNNSNNNKWKETTKFKDDDGSVLEWTGSNFFNKSNAGKTQVAPIEYNFEVDSPGTYYITLRAIREDFKGARGDLNNDFFVQFENGSHEKIFFSGPRGEFRWAGLFDPGHGQKKVPATFKVTQDMINKNDGVFTLTVSARSKNAAFDEVHIQKGKASRDDDAPTSKLIKDGNGNSGGNNNPPPSDDNDDPVAKNDTFTTGHNKTQFIDVLKNDSDPDGDKLSIQSVSYDGDTSNVKIENGKIKVNPLSSATNERVEEIEYVVSDGNGGTDKGTLKVTVQAKDGGTPPVDDEPPADNGGDAPVAKDDTASTGQNKTIVVDVLKNDSDPDGGKLKLTDIDYDGNTSRVSIVDGKIKVNPLSKFDQARVETINYTVTDDEGDSTTATLKVNVGGKTDPDPVDPDPVDPPTDNGGPTAVDDTAKTGQDKTIKVDVLANDDGAVKIVDVEYDGNSSKVSISDNMIKVNPLRKFDDDRVEVITYTVEDENGAQSKAVLRVDVGNPGDSTVDPIDPPEDDPVDPPKDDPVDPPKDEPVEASALELFIADTKSDKVVAELEDGAKISSDDIGDSITFFATSDDEDAFKFVELSFEDITRKEKVEPYALFGDSDGDFRGGLDLDPGVYNVVAKGFDDNNKVIDVLDIDFAIVDNDFAIL